MKKPLYLLSQLPMGNKIDSSDGQAYYKRGVARFDLQDYNGSIADFTKALRIGPKNKWCYLYIGLAKIVMVDFPGAINNFSLAIKLSPMFSAAYYSRGLLKIELGQIDSGHQDLRKASELSDTNIFEGKNLNCN